MLRGFDCVKKRLCAAGLLAVVLFMFTGCMSMNYHITVDKKGNLSAEYEMMMEKQYANMLSGDGGDVFSTYKQNAIDQGYTVTEVETENAVGFKATGLKDVPPEQFADLLFGMGAQEDMSNQFSEKKGLFVNTYTMEAHIDLTTITSPEYADMFNEEVKIKLNITLPANAKAIDKQDTMGNNTYEWTLLIGENNEVMLQFQKLNYWNIAIAAVLLIVIIVFLILYWKKRKERQAEADADDVYEGQISMDQMNWDAEENNPEPDEEAPEEITDAEVIEPEEQPEQSSEDSEKEDEE